MSKIQSMNLYNEHAVIFVAKRPNVYRFICVCSYKLQASFEDRLYNLSNENRCMSDPRHISAIVD